MTQSVLAQIRELDAAAEKAGGYVAAHTVRPNLKGERDFTAVRRYSLQIGIPMHKLTREDYRRIGIRR